MSDLDQIEREIESFQRILDDINHQIEYQTRIFENGLERIARSLEKIASK
ncbi:MAG TPA: hypothetical protein VMZ29_04595 [Candidatus Bathyarchaeia archaeon]|nr:hypothetical protein [Candidatus Bathyarchaeia archaeon]